MRPVAWRVSSTGVAFQQGGALYQATNVVTTVAVIASWVWMLVTGIRLFRSVGRGAHERAPAATDEIG